MNITSTENIKKIAKQLDCGSRAFIDNTTGQLLFVPGQNNFTDFYKIDKWTSSEAFEIMSGFADQVSDNKLQSRLFDALRKKKTFREFKFVIDNSGDFRQQWFDFKNKWQQDFVAIQLNQLKPTDE